MQKTVTLVLFSETVTHSEIFEGRYRMPEGATEGVDEGWPVGLEVGLKTEVGYDDGCEVGRHAGKKIPPDRRSQATPMEPR